MLLNEFLQKINGIQKGKFVKATWKSTKVINGVVYEKVSNGVVRLVKYANIKGVVVKGTGGCRKIRWRYQHCGKTGGIRIIYYLTRRRVIHLMFIYVKNRQKELTMKQRQECKAMVKLLAA